MLSCGCWLKQVELCNCCETVVSCLIVKWEELNAVHVFYVSFFAPHLMKVIYTLLKIIFVLRLQKFVIKSIFCCRTMAYVSRKDSTRKYNRPGNGLARPQFSSKS